MNIEELIRRSMNMLKRVMVFRLKAGVDPDEFWKHWQEVHAEQYRKVPYLQKYVINHVVEPIKGEPVYWGLVETWWASKEEHAKMEQSPQFKAFNDPYFRERIEGAFAAWLEEKQIK